MKTSAIIANFVLWPIMQLGVAKIFVALPLHLFRKGDSGAGSHAGEVKLYRVLFQIRRWKGWLPDGGAWMKGGFAKKTLKSHQREYLERFIAEAKRGEAAHWVAMLFSSIFFLWNPRAVWPVLVVVAMILNLPCIITQRYNRFVLLRRLAPMSPARSA